MSQRPPVANAGAEAGADLDEAVSEVTRGTVQKAVLGATLLADHRRRQTDRQAADLSKAASEERQRATMDVLRARTGYAHAADARWVARADEAELANAWVNAEPWRQSDEVAARVHHLIGERLERDWPSLAREYARGVNDGLDPAEAMGTASRMALSADGDAAWRLEDDWPGLAQTYAQGVDAGLASPEAMRRATLTVLQDPPSEGAEDPDRPAAHLHGGVSIAAGRSGTGAIDAEPIPGLPLTAEHEIPPAGATPAKPDALRDEKPQESTVHAAGDTTTSGPAEEPTTAIAGASIHRQTIEVVAADDTAHGPTSLEAAVAPANEPAAATTQSRRCELPLQNAPTDSIDAGRSESAGDPDASSRLRSDWPALAGRYVRAIDDGLIAADALSRASRDTLAEPSPGTADDHAVLQAGIVQEQHAGRHLATPDDETTPDVDEHHEAVGSFVQETERGRALQAQAAASAPAPANQFPRSRFAPARTPAAAAPSTETRQRSRG